MRPSPSQPCLSCHPIMIILLNQAVAGAYCTLEDCPAEGTTLPQPGTWRREHLPCSLYTSNYSETIVPSPSVHV